MGDSSRSAEMFKVGFLTRLAELGISPSDFDEALTTKSAGFIDFAKSLANLMYSGGKLGLGVTAGVGLMGGSSLKGMVQADDEDLEEVKKDELASHYYRLAKDVRERTEQERRRRQNRRATSAY